MESARVVRRCAVLAAVVLAVGCSSELHPVKFNLKIVEGNKQIAKAAQAFRQTLVPLGKGQAVEPARARAAYEDVLAAIEAVRKDWAAVTPPATDNAKKLHEGYLAFLEHQKALTERHFLQMVRIVEDKAMDPKTKWDRVQQSIRDVSEQERSQLEKLTTVQQDFAGDVKMRLVVEGFEP
jgi:hypothetical protein